MKTLAKVLLLTLGFAIAGCATDPAAYDLKSPCVDSGKGEIHGA